jgi:hypothetical protein
MVTGIWAFVELYPRLEGFVNSTPRGEIDLAGVLGLPYGLVVLLVTLLAAGGFMVAEKIERRH